VSDGQPGQVAIDLAVTDQGQCRGLLELPMQVQIQRMIAGQVGIALGLGDYLRLRHPGIELAQIDPVTDGRGRKLRALQSHGGFRRSPGLIEAEALDQHLADIDADGQLDLWQLEGFGLLFRAGLDQDVKVAGREFGDPEPCAQQLPGAPVQVQSPQLERQARQVQCQVMQSQFAEDAPIDPTDLDHARRQVLRHGNGHAQPGLRAEYQAEQQQDQDQQLQHQAPQQAKQAEATPTRWRPCRSLIFVCVSARARGIARGIVGNAFRA
jgi:hypothetical protein